MNASSILGRTVPNFLADIYGPLNGKRTDCAVQISLSDHTSVIIPSSVISAALVFAMFGATSTAGVVAFGVFYGFFSGGGQ